jgi:tryptophan-rich sensory protein
MTTFKKSVALFTFALMILTNGLASWIPINGVTTGDVSDAYANLFTPAGYTFSIWGLIYTLLAIATYGLITGSKVFLDTRVYWSYVISNVLNTFWILAWHYDMIGLSLAVISAMLICLVVIGMRLKGIKGIAGVTFSIYLGWIMVATVANVTIFLVSIGFDPGSSGPVPWTIGVLVVAAVIIIATGLSIRRASTILVGLWAYAGILSRHLGELGNVFPEVVIVLATLMMAFAVPVIFLLLRLTNRSSA